MIASRLYLAPTRQTKLLSESSSEYDEALFLINLRLRELKLLLPLKQLALVQIRKRMASRGASVRLESELADQQEQIQDLTQLAEDWLNIAELITQQPHSLDDLSEPIKRMLQSLGIQIDSSTSINNSANSNAR